MKIKNFTDIKISLFDNLTVKQTIFKNTFWLGTGTIINRILKLVLLIYAARILGATEYGKFTFAFAFVSLFVVFHQFGLSSIITREFSGEKWKKEEFHSIISLKILLSFVTFLLVLFGSFFVTSSFDVQKIILILALFSLINGLATVFYAFFQARQKMQYEALMETLQAVLVTGIGLFILFKFPSVENLSYSYLFGVFVVLIFLLFFFHFKIFPLKIAWEKTVWRKFLTMSWPLALTSLFGVIYVYIDSVMMGYWGMMTETGWYNAAYRIVIVSLIPMGLISGSFYPVLSEFFKESKEKLQNIWNHQIEIMILFVVPLVTGGIVLAPKIINFIYGQYFSPSILAFQILIIMAGICSLYDPFHNVLIVSEQQKKIFWIALLGALINIILNLILIPKYSLYGAAIATLITYILIFLLYLRFTIKFTSIQPFNLKFLFIFIAAALSSTVMYFGITQPLIYNLNIFLSTFIGFLIYAIIFFILRRIFIVLRSKNNF